MNLRFTIYDLRAGAIAGGFGALVLCAVLIGCTVRGEKTAQLLGRAVVLPPELPALSPLPMRRTATVVVTKPVKLAWDTVQGATSYKLYWGLVSGIYLNQTVVSNLTVALPLVPNQTYYLAVTALNATMESPFSSELVYTVPPGVSTVLVTVTIEGADAVAGPWKQLQLPSTYADQTTNGQRYYRALMQIAR